MYDKFLVGSVVDGDTAGTIPMNTLIPRPVTENAFGQTSADGPYDYFGTMGLTRHSVQITVSGGGTATVALQGTNGDPADVNNPWFQLDTSGALDATLDSVSDLLVTDVAVRFMRLVWSSGANSPDIDAHYYGLCE